MPMNEEILSEEQIGNITDAVKKLFPATNSIALTITEEGRCRGFYLDMTVTLEEVTIQNLSYKWLMDFVYSRDEIAERLAEYLKERVDPRREVQIKINNLDLTPYLDKSQYRLGEKLKYELNNNIDLEITIDHLVNKIAAEMTFLINRGLTSRTEQTLESFEKNKILSFILRKAQFDPHGFGVYFLDSAKDLNRLVKNLNEVGELAKQAKEKEYFEIAKSFMRSLNRTDINDLEQLVKVFTDDYVNCLPNQKAFIEQYLTNTVTSYGYTLINGDYVVDLT